MNKVMHSYVQLFMKVFALCLQEAWIPRERIGAPYEPFTSGDGFDLYVDGCRHLPDAVTLSKVDKMFLFAQNRGDLALIKSCLKFF